VVHRGAWPAVAPGPLRRLARRGAWSAVAPGPPRRVAQRMTAPASTEQGALQAPYFGGMLRRGGAGAVVHVSLVGFGQPRKSSEKDQVFFASALTAFPECDRERSQPRSKTAIRSLESPLAGPE